MIRGTTPTFTLTIKNPDINLGEANNVYVTFGQGAKTIEKSGEALEVDGRTVSVWLEQKESLDLMEGKEVEIQVNWTYLDIDGETIRRAATIPKSVPVTKQLLKRVIE